VLQSLARSKNPSVRWQVYVALEKAPFGRDILRDAIASDGDSYARRRAIGTYMKLAMREGPVRDEVLGLLSTWLRDPDEYVRATAVNGIGRLLSSAASDPSEVVRKNLHAMAKRLEEGAAAERNDDDAVGPRRNKH